MNAKEAVIEGARLFADVEDALTALAAGMPGIINAVRDDGAIGGLEALRLVGVTTADIGSVIGEIAEIHNGLTDRCIELGIDIPTMRSGGGR